MSRLGWAGLYWQRESGGLEVVTVFIFTKEVCIKGEPWRYASPCEKEKAVQEIIQAKTKKKGEGKRGEKGQGRGGTGKERECPSTFLAS